MRNFADRLMDAIDAKKSCVVVGLDPRLELLPQALRPAGEISAEEAARTYLEFGKRVIDAVAPHCVAVKPQSAFYEVWGAEGVRCYHETMAYAREKGLIVIADVKRGDIGSTAAAYAEAHLARSPADAVTVNPYFGLDGVKPFLEAAAARGKGVFLLVRTSNPSSIQLQEFGPEPGLYMRVAELAADWGRELLGERGYSALGAVVGATFAGEASQVRRAMPHAYFLVPGYGAQGASAEDCRPCFNEDGYGAVVNSSRGIIFSYLKSPWKEKFGQERWQEAVEQAALAMKQELNAALAHGRTT